MLEPTINPHECELAVFRGRGTCAGPDEGEDFCAGCLKWQAESDAHTRYHQAVETAERAAWEALTPQEQWFQNKRMGRLLRRVAEEGFSSVADSLGGRLTARLQSESHAYVAALAFDLVRDFGGESAAVDAITGAQSVEHGLVDDIYQESVLDELRRWTARAREDAHE